MKNKPREGNSFRMGLYETDCFISRPPRHSVDPDRPWVIWVKPSERMFVKLMPTSVL